MSEYNRVKTIRNIELAISDIKRGYPVLLSDDNGNSKMILAVESLFVTGWGIFSNNDYSAVDKLIISKERAKHIFESDIIEKLIDSDISIDCKNSNLSLNELEEISAVCGDVKKIRKNVTYKLSKASDIESYALELVKIAELLPAIIVVDPVSQKNNDYNSVDFSKVDCINVNVNDVLEYQEIISNDIEIIAASDLVLKDVESSSIKIFRAFPSSKEHYAIVIGNINTEKPPIVRIHSSCYTGDLLASLECDCRDQLHEAISVMSKDGGGILLYLIQEGRGIGLANKIRAYDLKNNGYDTIEANEIIGFDDDERPYKLAAEMLRKLDVKEIRLLTNNPRKIAAMEKNNIKVSKVVSHIMERNDHNKIYLETKFSRLGHIFEE